MTNKRGAMRRDIYNGQFHPTTTFPRAVPLYAKTSVCPMLPAGAGLLDTRRVDLWGRRRVLERAVVVERTTWPRSPVFQSVEGWTECRFASEVDRKERGVESVQPVVVGWSENGYTGISRGAADDEQRIKTTLK